MGLFFIVISNVGIVVYILSIISNKIFIKMEGHKKLENILKKLPAIYKFYDKYT